MMLGRLVSQPGQLAAQRRWPCRGLSHIASQRDAHWPAVSYRRAHAAGSLGAGNQAGKLAVVRAVQSGGGDDDDQHLEPTTVQQPQPIHPEPAAALPPQTSPSPLQPPAPQQQQAQSNSNSTLTLLGTLLVVIVTAVANRVFYKMALVPMANYVFWLAQLQTFGYLLVYFTVLALRYRAGMISKKMLSFPLTMPRIFLLIGLVEALSSLLGFLGAANLPGVVLPLLAQTILLWQVLLAVTLLGKRLGAPQFIGVSLVMCGVCLAAWPQSGGSPLDGINPLYAGIFVFSMLFPALDTIFKERVFRQARHWLKQDLDLFVVNSAGSLAQSFFVFLMLPIMAATRGMSLRDLPQYVVQGWQCFNGLTPACGSDCSGAPLLPVAYVALNLIFNISALELIRRAGNVAISLTMSAIVPITIVAFTMPLPYLPAAPPLGLNFLLGTVVLLLGLGVFNAPLWLPALMQQAKSWAADTGSGGSQAGLAVSPK